MKMFSIRRRYGVLALATLALVVGCGGGDGDEDGDSQSSLIECPADSADQQARGAQVIETRCNSCHAPNTGMQGGYDFTDAAVVRENAEKMMSEVDAGEMPAPPSPALEKSAVDDLRVYLSCL
ncbi:c-type cytochrome [Chondromyces apiculatus]|uniref:c-type cytochrome n=1 Tax=Chondromyces apiculatus TaxID=51 RepID=UPI0005C4FA17|nr:hypothetical protein [Chondromyces apiculatus]